MKSRASCGGSFSRAAYELGLSFAILILAGCGGSSNGSNGNGNGNGNPPPPPPPHLAVWTNTNFGLPFTMVGTDPSIAGAGTTTIPAVIIPVSFNFSAVGVVMSPDSISCGDSDTALSVRRILRYSTVPHGAMVQFHWVAHNLGMLFSEPISGAW
jgi:hypothetical protein